MRRTRLINRVLPDYTRGEEIMNMVTHISGGGLGILILVLCVIKSVLNRDIAGLMGSIIYGSTMIALYAVSSVYHGLLPSTGKKVMQVIDHCSIYFLIAGTYTPLMFSGFIPQYPFIGWSILAMEWALTTLAVTLTAIDLKKYNIFSMVCYIFRGWGIIFFVPQAVSVFTKTGFLWLLSGGIVYTIGAILYGIGSKRRWFHSIFHIFVVIGSLLQFITIFFYAL